MKSFPYFGFVLALIFTRPKFGSAFYKIFACQLHVYIFEREMAYALASTILFASITFFWYCFFLFFSSEAESKLGLNRQQRIYNNGKVLPQVCRPGRNA